MDRRSRLEGGVLEFSYHIQDIILEANILLDRDKIRSFFDNGSILHDGWDWKVIIFARI